MMTDDDDDARLVCDLCATAAQGEEVAQWVSASGHEVVCDDCMDTLTPAEDAYIRGRGAPVGRFARRYRS